MNPDNSKIIAIQEARKNSPKIWYCTVTFEGCQEPTGNFHDSRDGAELERAYLVSRRERAHINCSSVDSLETSQLKWGVGTLV
jgi:hypothetical protein